MYSVFMTINQYVHYVVRNEHKVPVNYFECSENKCEQLVFVNKNPVDQLGLCNKCHLVFCKVMHFDDHLKTCRADLRNYYSLYKSSQDS